MSQRLGFLREWREWFLDIIGNPGARDAVRKYELNSLIPTQMSSFLLRNPLATPRGERRDPGKLRVPATSRGTSSPEDLPGGRQPSSFLLLTGEKVREEFELLSEASSGRP